MKKTALTALFAAAGLGLSLTATAQSLSETVSTNVAEIQSTAKEDRYVSLQGQINKQLSKEKFIFTDSTGEIQLEINDELTAILPLNPPVDVEVFGEVDKDGGQYEIDVHYYTIR